MWCNVMRQCSARISIQGAVQSGDDADFLVSAHSHTHESNPSKIPYLCFYHINYVYVNLTRACFVSLVMVLGALVC